MTNDFYERAKQLINKGMYEQALLAYYDGVEGGQKSDRNTDYRRAVYGMANNGDKFAQYIYGCYCEFVKRDYKSACEWYRKSASQNNPDAIFNLAECYIEGRKGKRPINNGGRSAFGQNGLFFVYNFRFGIFRCEKE